MWKKIRAYIVCEMWRKCVYKLWWSKWLGNLNCSLAALKMDKTLFTFEKVIMLMHTFEFSDVMLTIRETNYFT